MSLPILAVLLLAAAQSQTPQPAPPPNPTHDISQVDIAPIGGAIAIPLPERERKKLAKYDIPELVGSRQAVGPQRIDGRLRKPLVDYSVTTSAVYQRISIFEGGLVVVEVRGGGGGVIRKKVIIPDAALHNYVHAMSPTALATVREGDL